MNWRNPTCCLLLVLAVGTARADTQHFAFRVPGGGVGDAAAAMKDLAVRMLPVYQESRRLTYLDRLSELQAVAGDYRSADHTRRSLQDLRVDKKLPAPVGRALLLDVYVHAQVVARKKKKPFARVIERELSVAVDRLDDLQAYRLAHWQGTPPGGYEQALQAAFDGVRAQHELDMPQALGLVRIYLDYVLHLRTQGAVAAVDRAQVEKRYRIEDDVPIKSAHGIVLHARVVRPRAIEPRPALLEFTIDRGRRDGVACAAHGYVGVMAYTRGTARAHGPVTPFEHDGDDARTVINWIAGQKWSDGRVGMIGDGYAGFAAWAATRDAPSALKAIATSGAIAPGIDFPMQGRIYDNSALRWATKHTLGTDEQGKDSDAFWRALNRSWYKSGRKYRDLGHIAGMPNRSFSEWLNHPSYDAYWRGMIPSGKGFAKVDIPTLTITGYFADRASGDLFYYRQHAHYRPDHPGTLLIGPYDDHSLRDNPMMSLRGLTVDPVARVNLSALRFAWLDHVFKGAPQPALLKGHVNTEVMGANRWAHAPTLEALAVKALTLYLSAAARDGHSSLVRTAGDGDAAVAQTVDFKDRGDADWEAPDALLRHDLGLHHAVAYVGEPLKRPLEITGRWSLWLDFRVNKMDMDVDAALYAQRADGRYVLLAHALAQRASYAGHRDHRHLLRAGVRQQLRLTSAWMTAVRVPLGDRLVLVLGISKRPDREINYGAGKDVSAASIADAGRPLEVHWYADSYLELPIAPLPQPAVLSKPAVAPKHPGPATSASRSHAPAGHPAANASSAPPPSAPSRSQGATGKAGITSPGSVN